MTTTHRIEPAHPGRTLCCDKAVAELPASAGLVFQDASVTCPNVNTGDNLHVALANALNRPTTTSNRDLLKEVTRNGVQLAGYKQGHADALVIALRLRDEAGETDPIPDLDELIKVLR